MKKLLILLLFLSSCWGDDGGIYLAKAILENATEHKLEINAFFNKKNVKKISLNPRQKIEFYVSNVSSSYLEGYPFEQLDSINLVFNGNRMLVENCGVNIFDPKQCSEQRFNSTLDLVGQKLSYFRKYNDKKIYRNSICLSITDEDYKKAIPF